MKVILIAQVDNLGKIGEIVTVKPGYARNFLIPSDKAMIATEKNIKTLKEQQLVLQLESEKKSIEAQSYLDKIQKLGSVTISVRSGIEGKLFGSIGARDIAIAVTKLSGIKISKSQVRFLGGESFLKMIGTYSAQIHIYNNIYAALNVIIVDSIAQD